MNYELTAYDSHIVMHFIRENTECYKAHIVKLSTFMPTKRATQKNLSRYDFKCPQECAAEPLCKLQSSHFQVLILEPENDYEI